MKVFFIWVSTFAIVLIGVGSISATPMIYFGEDNGDMVRTNSDVAHSEFMSTLINPAIEDFESYEPRATTPPDLDFGLAGVATLNGNGYVNNSRQDGRWAVSGNQYWEALSTDFSISFSRDDIMAFGFYGTDIGDVRGQLLLSLTYTDSSISTLSINVGNTIGAEDGAALFFGIVDRDNAIKSIAFGNSNMADHFGFDDMTIATSSQINEVPEPSTLLLFGLGLAGLVGGSLKRRKR